MPATPISTASHTSQVFFCLNSTKPKMGTSSMYMAVMNPALPAVVVTRPICWKMVAVARKKPQPRPPSSVLRCVSARSAVPAGSALRPVSSATAPTAAADSHIRAAQNVSGSMLSMPTRWATKAVPQIRAVRVSSRLPSSLPRFASLSVSPMLTSRAPTRASRPPRGWPSCNRV